MVLALCAELARVSYGPVSTPCTVNHDDESSDGISKHSIKV